MDEVAIKTVVQKHKILSTVLSFFFILVFISFLCLIFYRMFFLTFVDNYQLAYKFDARNGQIEVVNRTGYIQGIPFLVSVHTVELRPMQVCISANQRILNCKLVQFNPAGLELFLKWHGRDNYTNNGTRETPSQFNQILMAYAYEGSGKSYPFLTIVRVLNPEEVEAQR